MPPKSSEEHEQVTTKEIVVRPPVFPDHKPLEDINFEELIRSTTELLRSGYLPNSVKTPQQAVTIVLMGRELGIPPMQALRQINVIQGKPTLAAELMLVLAYKNVPGFLMQVMESTADICTVKMFRPGFDDWQEHSFTLEDAKQMGLAGKDNWKKQPATMLRWRAISAALRFVVPDAIAGIYTPEEINPDLEVNADGTVNVVPDSISEPRPAPKREEKPKTPPKPAASKKTSTKKTSTKKTSTKKTSKKPPAAKPKAEEPKAEEPGEPTLFEKISDPEEMRNYIREIPWEEDEVKNADPDRIQKALDAFEHFGVAPETLDNLVMIPSGAWTTPIVEGLLNVYRCFLKKLITADVVDEAASTIDEERAGGAPEDLPEDDGSEPQGPEHEGF